VTRILVGHGAVSGLNPDRDSLAATADAAPGSHQQDTAPPNGCRQ